MNNIIKSAASVINKHPLKIAASIGAVLIAVAVVSVFWLTANPVVKNTGQGGTHISTTHGGVTFPVEKNKHILTRDGGAGIGSDAVPTSEVPTVEGQAVPTTPVTEVKTESKPKQVVKSTAPVATAPASPQVSVPSVPTQPAPVVPVPEAPVTTTPTVDVEQKTKDDAVYVDWAYTPAGLTGSVLVSYRATPQGDNTWECAWRGGASLVDGVLVQQWVPYGFASNVENCKDVYASLN